MMTSIHWAKKLRPEKLKQLYESDAAGFLDEELLADVGLTLYLRCQSIVLISRGEVACPDCLRILRVQPEPLTTTCVCGWTTTSPEYRSSWRHRDLNSGKALGIFEKFVSRWQNAKSAPERILLVDQLIHAFHWEAQQVAPNRSVGNNLIEGSHKRVIAFLDELTSSLSTNKEEWRSHVDAMWKRRRGE